MYPALLSTISAVLCEHTSGHTGFGDSRLLERETDRAKRAKMASRISSGKSAMVRFAMACGRT
jgi:hypothetical protein